MDERTAAECVADLCEAFRTPLSERASNLYHQAIVGMDEDAGVEAVYDLIRDSRYLPRIAEIREHYRDVHRRQERDRAWDWADDVGLPKDSTAAETVRADRREVVAAMLERLAEPPPEPEPGVQLTRSDLVRGDRKGRRVCRWDVEDPGWDSAWGHVLTRGEALAAR